MLPQRKGFVETIKCLDLAATVLCFCLAAWAVAKQDPEVPWESFLEVRISLSNLLIVSGFILAWYPIFASLGLYQISRFSTLLSQYIAVVKATCVGTGWLLVVAAVAEIGFVDRLFVVVFWVSITFTMILSRVALHYAAARVHLMGINLLRLVIVGTNDRAVRFADEVRSRPELGYQVLGFVDDVWENTPRFRNAGYNHLGAIDQFPAYLRTMAIDQVLVCLPMKSHYETAERIVSMCEEQGVRVGVVPDLFYLKLARSRIDHLAGSSVIVMVTGAMEGSAMLAKRALDVVGSAALLALLAPLMVAVALLIRLTSPGPALFAQERLGLNKRRFRIYKFRTMVANAEQMQRGLEKLNESDGAAFKIRNDPRVTPLGRFLRKTSIDELPQLINVLKGDMSLVGPRPLPVRDFAEFDEDWHRRRFSVRPGITCLWQISGRSHVSFDTWMKLDMSYIDNWSLWLDLKILVATIPAVIRGAGAV